MDEHPGVDSNLCGAEAFSGASVFVTQPQSA